MPLNFTARRAPQSVAVSTTVLRLNGASSWTGNDPDSAEDRTIAITNNGTSNNIAVRIQPVADAAPNQATVEAGYDLRLLPGETNQLFVGAGTVAYVVRAAGTANVTARVFVW